MAKCERCGAAFDYDEKQGVCPKCCFYNRPPGAARQDTEWMKYYNVEDNSYQLPKSEGLEDLFPEKKFRWTKKTIRKEKKKERKKSRSLSGKVCAGVIIIIILLAAAMFVLQTVNWSGWKFEEKEEVDNSSMMTVNTKTAEEAAEGIAAGDVTYWIGEAKTFFKEGEIKDLPAGEKCIGIWIEDNESIMEYTGFEWERPYLFDGTDYRQMVDVDSLDDVLKFVNNGIVSFPVYGAGYEDQSGYGIFFVDADASVVTLSIPCQITDQENTDQMEYSEVIDITIPLT